MKQGYTGIRIHGRIGRFEVRVLGPLTPGRRRDERQPTTFVLEFHQRLPVQMTLQSEGPVTRFTKFFGFDDIEIGDPAFDEAIYIQSQHYRELERFLTPVRRKAILALVQDGQMIVITRREIHVIRLRPISHPEQITVPVRRMVALAERLCGDDGNADAAVERDETRGRPDRVSRPSKEVESEVEVENENAEAAADLEEPEVVAAEKDAATDMDAGMEDDVADLESEIEPAWNDAWLIQGVLPEWMAEQRVRLDEAPEVPDVDEPEAKEGRE